MWTINNNRLMKVSGDSRYMVEHKPPLEEELDGEWIAYRCYDQSMVELVKSRHLERAIGACNRDSKKGEERVQIRVPPIRTYEGADGLEWLY